MAFAQVSGVGETDGTWHVKFDDGDSGVRRSLLSPQCTYVEQTTPCFAQVWLMNGPFLALKSLRVGRRCSCRLGLSVGKQRGAEGPFIFGPIWGERGSEAICEEASFTEKHRKTDEEDDTV